MSIRAVRLQNFRGFRDSSVELKPLTVLLGPNSAGKSAFGQALAAIRHCQWRHSGSAKATLTPSDKDWQEWPVDLGQLADLCTDGASDVVRISLLMDEGWVQFGFGLPTLDHVRDLILSFVEFPIGEDASKPGPAPSVLTVEAPQEMQSGQKPTDMVRLPAPTSGLPLRRVDEINWLDERNNAQAFVQLDGLIVETVAHKGGTSFLLSSSARNDIRFLLSNLSYLRATRQRPVRGSRDEPLRPQAIGYAGERTAHVLREYGSRRTEYRQPPSIPNGVDEARASLDKEWPVRETSLQIAINEWLQLLRLADSVESIELRDQRAELQIRVTIPGQQPHDITEVGFGLSQLVPILTAGLMQPEASLFIVDLPEAHLHPRPQAELADFFCSLALSNRFALVETHSEMFFHRLRLRAEMNSDLANKIQVYFIDPPQNGLCCPPRTVGLRATEEPKWPPGFLQEAWETEMSLEAARQARKELNK